MSKLTMASFLPSRAALLWMLFTLTVSASAWAQDLVPGPASGAMDRKLVISPNPDSVLLSVYRDPQALNDYRRQISRWPGGYALITETRTIDLPAGEFVLRFEGVADGIFPESAIVSGLPEGVHEKNRDARLLSPAGLLDAYVQRTVQITRTNSVTGEVRDMQARITAAPNGAVILQTEQGYEALHCTGLPERMLFDQVPSNLSAKPTLSVLASSTAANKATVTLSYLAEGFDWQANYLANIVKSSANGQTTVELLAWLTLSNGGQQSFANASTMVIAGAPNRENPTGDWSTSDSGLRLQCWPQQRTHEVPLRSLPRSPIQPIDDLNWAPGIAKDVIVVTGSRIKRMDTETASPVLMMAKQEDLGDLKLYRVPEPVSVNAQSQKQVALMFKPKVKLQAYYFAQFYAEGVEYLAQIFQNEVLSKAANQSKPMTLKLRAKNLKKNGLGLPLPKGKAEVFEQDHMGRLWLGSSDVSDLTVGDELELSVGESSDVRLLSKPLSQKISGDRYHTRWRLSLSNAKNSAVQAEVQIPYDIQGKIAGAKKIDGILTWQPIIPAFGVVSIEFVVVQER